VATSNSILTIIHVLFSDSEASYQISATGPRLRRGRGMVLLLPVALLTRRDQKAL
jgi:hypothetical protein